MNSGESREQGMKELRQRAEKLVRRQRKIHGPEVSEVPDNILEELNIYQAELEMQNDELRKARETLEESVRRYQELYEKAPVAYFTICLDGIVQEVNQAGAQMLGLEKQQIVGGLFTRFIVPHSQDSYFLHVRALQREESGKRLCVELQLRTTGKEVLDVLCESVAVRDEAGTLLRWRTTASDISPQKEVETRLKNSLVEKDSLLREVYHRVKNNLQVISGLLYLKIKPFQGEQEAALHRDLESYIRAMALVHQKIYESRDLVRINFREYIESYMESLIDMYTSQDSSNVKIQLSLDDVYLCVEQAIPCGLALNELVTNAIKHAFPNGECGKVEVKMNKLDNGMIELIVRDNGIGIPESINFETTKSMGLDLIKGFVQSQLQGTVDLIRDNGTTFRIHLCVR